MGPDIDMKFHQEVMEIVRYDNGAQCGAHSIYMYPEVNCTKNTEILEHCSCSIYSWFQQITNSQNNKKSVVGMFQPLFVTGCCKIMGQWFLETTRLVNPSSC